MEQKLTSEFINEQKILDYLQNDLKLPLIRLSQHRSIDVFSTVHNVKKLAEFCEKLHYKLCFFGMGEKCFLSIIPQ